MDRTTAVIGGVVALILLVGLVVYVGGAMNTPSLTATTTPTPSGENTDITQKPVALPLVITNSTAAPANTAAVVNGWVTPNGAFTNYWYEYGLSATLGARTANQMVGSGYVAIATPAFITGLVKDTSYYFRLVAQNQIGTVNGAVYTFTTSSTAAAPVGAVPTVKTLSAANVSRTGATLSGEITPNQAVTQYWFEYGATPNLGNVTAFTSIGGGTAKVAASAVLANLTPLATYYFRVNAQNQFGTVNGSIESFKTAGPTAQALPKVVTLTANTISTSTALLRGTIDPSGAETTYWFEYSTNASLTGASLVATSQTSLAVGLSLTSVSAPLTGLARSTTYYFKLVAQNSLGITRGERQSFKTE